MTSKTKAMFKSFLVFSLFFIFVLNANAQQSTSLWAKLTAWVGDITGMNEYASIQKPTGPTSIPQDQGFQKTMDNFAKSINDDSKAKPTPENGSEVVDPGKPIRGYCKNDGTIIRKVNDGFVVEIKSLLPGGGTMKTLSKTPGIPGKKNVESKDIVPRPEQEEVSPFEKTYYQNGIEKCIPIKTEYKIVAAGGAASLYK